MDWSCGSSSRAPALQVQRLEFKLQSHQKKEQYNFHPVFKEGFVKNEDIKIKNLPCF
jgi:hypothetical protein